MSSITLPQFFRVRQSFDSQRIDDVEQAVIDQLQRIGVAKRVQPGQSVAITAGSRGIANIALIIRTIVRFLQSAGAQPFIVPAMGSHGGATAEGQCRVLASYGITEAYCGCPIRASMETIIVCQAAEGFPVFFDKFASQADHVVVCGRVKPHTDFSGPIESGLMKMMLIGLGKHDGAKVYHRAIKDYSFGQIVRSVGREVLSRCRILCGVGLVENAYEKTAHIEAVLPSEFETREEQLLILAKKRMAKLPFEQADVLLVDEIGKNISGTGMDTNIIGRKYNDHQAVEGETPKIKRIAVRRLTKATYGNATGIGIAEFCRTSIVEQMDYASTSVNCITAGHVTAAMIPIHFPNDRLMMNAGVTTIGLTEPQQAKVLWIKNTLELVDIECSESYWEEAQQRSDLEIVRPLTPLPFGRDDCLPEVDSLPGHLVHASD
jgi:Lactate racemase N-terminal domain